MALLLRLFESVGLKVRPVPLSCQGLRPFELVNALILCLFGQFCVECISAHMTGLFNSKRKSFNDYRIAHLLFIIARLKPPKSLSVRLLMFMSLARTLLFLSLYDLNFACLRPLLFKGLLVCP